MGKINISELLAMAEAKTPQKDMAAHFGVSEAAISKRLKKLRPVPRPAILDKLTEKEEKFVMARAEGKSATDAAEWAFDVTSRDSAKSQGCVLMKKEEIQEAITAVMNTEGLTRRKLVRKLADHVDSRDPQASLRAVDMGLKLHDAYPASKTKALNVNVEFPDVDVSRWFNG